MNLKCELINRSELYILSLSILEMRINEITSS